MSAELRELYQELILDHSKRPRNFREQEGARRAEGFNPLCGDKATVFVAVEDGIVKDVSFVGKGCSISTASASMMTEAVMGKPVEQAAALFARFHELVTGGPDPAGRGAAEELGKLAVFSGVCEFPVRVKCATLPWHTLRAALAGEQQPVSTDSGAESGG
jgi:nitrogen fixation NifU-like protein